MVARAQIVVWLVLISGVLPARAATVTARVQVIKHGGAAVRDASEVVLWLTPVNPSTPPPIAEPRHWQLRQSGKQFEPRLLVVPVGAAVEFPNHDPFFHNVFSSFQGKRFDLGLYESGSSRFVRFDKPGISYIFCNIHAEMSAVVITLETPYYAASDGSGSVSIPDVPTGRYILNVWYKGSLAEQLESLMREVTISEASHWLGTIRVTDAGIARLAHPNKYGRKYEDPPTAPGYSQ